MTQCPALARRAPGRCGVATLLSAGGGAARLAGPWSSASGSWSRWSCSVTRSTAAATRAGRRRARAGRGPTSGSPDWTAEAERLEARGRVEGGAALPVPGADRRAGRRRSVVRDLPGRTSGEYRDDLSATLPEAGADFGGASELFERAWYGDRPTGADERDRFADLADAGSAGRPASGSAPAGRRRVDDERRWTDDGHAGRPVTGGATSRRGSWPAGRRRGPAPCSATAVGGGPSAAAVVAG